MKKISVIFAIGLLILIACLAVATQAAKTPPLATPFPSLTPTNVQVFPTPSSPGSSVTWDHLQVTMEQLEFTEEYVTDFGSTRVPPTGGKFLWAHLRLKNTGQTEMNLPLAENFSVLYAATELKPTYGHRAGYTDYTTLGPVIFPGQELDGWLRFDLPATAELSELLFVFLPESSQIGASYDSPYYPYALDKPTYVWYCVP
ncbi:MAG TPA: hypothetical protein VJ785_03755 [Anaerolineales bacterium]|nr:hypothetical protein [Anaerolineales bacterium]